MTNANCHQFARRATDDTGLHSSASPSRKLSRGLKARQGWPFHSAKDPCNVGGSMTLPKIQNWLSALVVLAGISVSLGAAAAPLTIDGSVTTNTCPGGTVRDGGRACEY